LKIAFIGTHGVGKTTLCYELAARLKRLDYTVELVKEVARTCPLPINRDTTLDAQSWILHTQIAEELAAQSGHETVVCRLGRRPELDPLVGAWLSTYSRLIKVPLWRPPRYDGVRDVGRDFQEAIDRVLDELIVSFDVDVLRLAAPPGPHWAETVLDHLDLPPRAEQVSLFPEDA